MAEIPPRALWGKEVVDGEGRRLGTIVRVGFRHGRLRRFGLAGDQGFRFYHVAEVRLEDGRVVVPVESSSLHVVH